MFARSPGYPLVSRRSALAGTALALLAACADHGARPSGPTRKPWEPVLGLVEGRPVLLLLELEVLELGSAVLPTPRAAWTRAAEAEVTSALQQLAAAHRIGIVPFDRDRASEEERARAARLRAALLAPLRPKPGWGVVPGTTLPLIVVEDEDYRPEIGALPLSLGQPPGIDYALYVLVRETRATAGLRAGNFERAERAAPGSELVTFHGGAFAYAALVDLPRAQVIDAVTRVDREGGTSLADPAGAAALLRALFRERGT